MYRAYGIERRETMKLRKVNTASENSDTFKNNNIHVIGVPEVRRKIGERKNI